MSFVHEDPDFEDLLRIAADARGLSIAMVEKDYWVTHVLWSLHAQGFEVWFKGGTSLSKGFGLIQRFSEDLDLKLEPGKVGAVPSITNWKSDKNGPTAARRAHFEALASAINVPGAHVTLSQYDRAWRSANFEVRYPGNHLTGLDPILSPIVLLEVGVARVTPAVDCAMSSFVHDVLVERDLLREFDDNRPASVRCVHPLVTLLEKLDALHRRVLADHVAPAKFVRHFEDAAQVIAGERALPTLVGYPDLSSLATEMVANKQLAIMPSRADDAFSPSSSARWNAIRAAHQSIAPMFWGPRHSIEESCDAIRGWLSTRLGD